MLQTGGMMKRHKKLGGVCLALAILSLLTEANLSQHASLQCFNKSVSNAKPDLSALPPSEGAAREHAFRVYHQIQFWLGNELPSVQWGWKLESYRLIPVTIEDPAAPEAVLNLVCCKCRGGCGNRCGCRKSGIMCTSICHNCHGERLNGLTSTLEENFDDPDVPDVINLEESGHSVKRTNTEHLVHEDQNTVLAGCLTRSQAASSEVDQAEQIAGPSTKKRSTVDLFYCTQFSLEYPQHFFLFMYFIVYIIISCLSFFTKL
ncbi:hypothetical protein JTB14_018033 [Gonioctena quinquepunctata]|nr:hypothetical protein JTB14_018033 [Gonioctena quinquepunctata]